MSMTDPYKEPNQSPFFIAHRVTGINNDKKKKTLGHDLFFRLHRMLENPAHLVQEEKTTGRDHTLELNS